MNFYRGRGEVLYSLPNTYLGQQSNTPNDFVQARQPQWWSFLGAADVVDAWDHPSGGQTSTGTFSPVVAVIDSGIDLQHVDLRSTIFINTAEIPQKFYAKAKDNNQNGMNDAGDLDVDGDGIVTFVDLNLSANDHVAADGGPACKKDNHGPNDVCDALDLVDGSGGAADSDGSCSGKTGYGWQDGVDADSNAFCDDIVGWHFGNNNNWPTEGNGHGTWMAGIIGATGNNAEDDTAGWPAMETNSYVGVNWSVRILPIAAVQDVGTGSLTGPKQFRDTTVNAMNYAAAMGVDVLNVSAAFIASKDNVSCKNGGGTPAKGGISDDNWNKFFNDMAHEFADTELLAPTKVVPNSLNIDGLKVGSSSVSNPGVPSDFSVGGDLVDLYAPGESYWVLHPTGGITDDCGSGHGSCSGTSEAAAMVSGVAALLIAAPAEFMPPMNTPCELANRILRNTSETLIAKVPHLDANLAITNANMTAICRPTFGCPQLGQNCP